MPIPFVDLHRQYEAHRSEIDAAIADVIADTAFISGPHVSAFEAAFARYVGVDHAVGCGNGTDALEMVLDAVGVGPGDEVIVPALTWISTAESVTTAGARPVFADVDPDTYTLDPSDVERKITAATKALIPVHLYGHLADMPALTDLAEAHDLTVIEDAAQAHGAALHDRAAGTWGHAATFSFYPGKNLGAYGDAGAVVTDDAQIAEHVYLLGHHGQPDKHNHQIEGRNSRLDGMQAAVLLAKLPHLDDWNDRRASRAARYGQRLQSCSEVHLPTCRPNARHVYHLYVIETDERDALQTHLDECGVSTSIHYPTALPFQPCYAHLGHAPEDVPVAYKATQRILSLPMFAELTDDEVDTVAESITDFYA